MKKTFIKWPHLTAIIKASGIESPVKWIDLEKGLCETEAGHRGAFYEFLFVDSRDYDSLRGEYAGRMMQAIVTSWNTDPKISDALADIAVKQGTDMPSKMMAQYAVRCTDALIRELKRPRELQELLGQIEDDSNK